MQVAVCYAGVEQQFWHKFDVPETCTVEEAIQLSGVLRRFPEIDLSVQRVGIFGKLAKMHAVLQEGDRVEIYRQITADPKAVRRRRVTTEDDDDD